MMDKEPYRETDGCLKDTDVQTKPSPDVVSYHRTTCRIGELALTFLEDGSINIKRKNETFSTTAKEMYEICTLSQSLRNFRREVGTSKLLHLDEETEQRRSNNKFIAESIEDRYAFQRKQILDEHGV